MDPAAGVIVAEVGILAVLLGAALWGGWRIRELRRVRGYAVVPPPGRHSVGAKRAGAADPSTRRGPRPATQPAPTLSVSADKSETRRSHARSAQPSAPATDALQSLERLEASRRTRRGSSAALPTKRLVAPVELWFGETCVGVVQGSDTHERFQDYASELLAELADPGSGAQQAGRLGRRRRAAKAVGASTGYAGDSQGR